LGVCVPFRGSARHSNADVPQDVIGSVELELPTAALPVTSAQEDPIPAAVDTEQPSTAVPAEQEQVAVGEVSLQQVLHILEAGVLPDLAQITTMGLAGSAHSTEPIESSAHAGCSSDSSSGPLGEECSKSGEQEGISTPAEQNTVLDGMGLLRDEACGPEEQGDEGLQPTSASCEGGDCEGTTVVEPIGTASMDVMGANSMCLLGSQQDCQGVPEESDEEGRLCSRPIAMSSENREGPPGCTAVEGPHILQ
jgi:hypothetical protein